MIEALRSVRYGVGDLALARQWYSQLLDVQPYQSTDSVLRYCVDGSWLELVAAHTEAPSSVLVYWGVDSLVNELQRLHAVGIKPQTPPTVLDASMRTATFLDPFGTTIGLIELDDPDLRRARSHRAAEKIALRNVRTALDDLSVEDRQQRAANRLVLALVAACLVLGAFAIWNMLPHKPQEDKIVIPLPAKK